MHIGIDVGGTNTDAVVMDGRSVVASTKAPTSEDVTSGVVAVLDQLSPHLAGASVDAVAIGTTHFTNAVVQRRGLAPTAALRLGLPASSGVPPMSGWPADLVESIGGHTYLCSGGHEFDGREISALDTDELLRVADDLATKYVTSVAITSIFSPATPHMEQQAAEILLSRVPDLRISLSHEIGRIGLLERENATIINASLLPVAEQITHAFAEALDVTAIEGPLYLSQNDGTLMDVDFVRDYPVATFAAGPTNSMRGAALLSGFDDCIVVDIGGTTTDVGAVVGGFPRPATTEVDIAGVRTNFRMPDVISIGIGGGSRVAIGPDPKVGPDSVGHRLAEDSRVFGGSTLTATDLAVAGGLAEVGDPRGVDDLDPVDVRRALGSIADRVGRLADTMRVSSEPIPLVLVGGGSILIDDVPGFDEVVRPADFAVANAIGAAIAQVGGEVDRIYAAGSSDRSTMLDGAREEATAKAILAGAEPDSVSIVEVDELPIAYLPGDSVRIRIKAVGDLALERSAS